MSNLDKIILIDELIKENKEITIKEYLETLEEIDRIKKAR